MQVSSRFDDNGLVYTGRGEGTNPHRVDAPSVERLSGLVKTPLVKLDSCCQILWQEISVCLDGRNQRLPRTDAVYFEFRSLSDIYTYTFRG